MTNEIQQYGGWDLTDVAAQGVAVEEGGGGKAAYFKPEVGRNLVRFLPPRTPGTSPLVVTTQHYIDLPDRKVVFSCPRALVGKPCPACQRAEALRATGNQVDREAAYGIQGKLRIFSNVINRAKPEAGPVIYAYGKKMFEALQALRLDPDINDFTRPTEDGVDIVIERKGTGKMDTEYAVRPAMKVCGLGDLSVIEQQHDLTQFSRVLSWDAIMAKLKGDKPAVTSPAPQASRAPALPVPAAPAVGVVVPPDSDAAGGW